MKPLLLTSSALYLRRLARELNSLPDGFYLVGAGFAAGNLRCRHAAVSKDGFLHVLPNGDAQFRVVSPTSKFVDAYGRSVVASRSVR